MLMLTILYIFMDYILVVLELLIVLSYVLALSWWLPCQSAWSSRGGDDLPFRRKNFSSSNTYSKLKRSNHIKTFDIPCIGKVTWIEMLANWTLLGFCSLWDGILPKIGFLTTWLLCGWFLDFYIGRIFIFTKFALCLATTFLKSMRLKKLVPGLLFWHFCYFTTSSGSS